MEFEWLPSPNSAVLVVGDTMLDRYWIGDSNRISPEAPVPVVHVHCTDQRLGGAANVARNVAALGARAYMLGIVGADEAGDTLQGLLAASGVQNFLQVDRNVRTSTKLRILSRGQQLMRADFEDGLRRACMKTLLAEYRRLLSSVEAVVLSDYGKGTLLAVQEMISIARNSGKPVFIDPKGADFDRYRGATLITPNRLEFETVVGHCESNEMLHQKAQELLERLELDELLVTRGEEGLSLISRVRNPMDLPTNAREVFDVTGAGDTVIATLATCVAAGHVITDACQIANVAAGIVVGKVGTAVASPAEIMHSLCKHTPDGDVTGVSEDLLLDLVSTARERGERVVLSSGCFDVLEERHIAYLEDARRRGDRLVVAVIERPASKGPPEHKERVNSIPHTVKLISSLRAVDWVVTLPEPNLETLYARLQADVLVSTCE